MVKRADALRPGDKVVLDERGTVVTVVSNHLLSHDVLLEWQSPTGVGWSCYLRDDNFVEAT